jgi:hypothetical protein
MRQAAHFEEERSGFPIAPLLAADSPILLAHPLLTRQRERASLSKLARSLIMPSSCIVIAKCIFTDSLRARCVADDGCRPQRSSPRA